MTRSITEELKDVETSPDRLRELFRPGVNGAHQLLLTKHPSTPTEILLRLGETYPTELLQNPLFPLLLLETPNAALEWPNKTVQALLSCAEIPMMMVEGASRHPREAVRAAAAAHPLATPEILHRLSRDPHAQVSGKIAEHRRTPPELLHELASHKAPYVRATIAKNPNTKTETLHLLARDSDTGVRLAVASHPNTSEESLTLLVADYALNIRAAVAVHPRAPHRIVSLLASVEGDPVFSLSAEQEEELAGIGPYGGLLLARRMTTPGHLLLRIVVSYSLCESDVAAHPLAPPEALLYLAERYPRHIRMKVAAHVNTPAEALSLLLADDEPEVRQAAMRHPASPLETLSLLRRAGADEELRSIQSAQPLTRSELELLLGGKRFAQELLVYHPETPPEMLKKLVRSFPQEVARHPRATIEVLQETAPYAPKESAQHRNARPLLEELTKHRLRGVRHAVAKNPVTPESALTLLTQDDCREIRYAVARHPNAGALCEGFATDKDWLLRRATARHPATSSETLWRLAQDPDPRVHRSARALHRRRATNAERYPP